jgi:hypothetical protein
MSILKKPASACSLSGGAAVSIALDQRALARPLPSPQLRSAVMGLQGAKRLAVNYLQLTFGKVSVCL